MSNPSYSYEGDSPVHYSNKSEGSHDTKDVELQFHHETSSWSRSLLCRLVSGCIILALVGGLIALIVCMTGNCGKWEDETKTGCAAFEMVHRADWEAREPASSPTTIPATNSTFIHHTVTAHCTSKDSCSQLVKSMQNYHMDTNGWNDIAYNFLVGEDGRVYEGRGWNILGSHASIYNSMSHGIAVIGNFMDVEPAQVALTTIKNLIQCGVEQDHILENYELFGHRDGRCTLCPGDLLYDEIRSWPHHTTRYIYRVCAPCEALEFVSREEWGARPRKGEAVAIAPTNMTTLHHTAGTWCETKEDCIQVVQDIQNLHMDGNGWDDIGYNFLVGEDGRVYEGRGWLVQGAHSPTYNSISHGMCIIGNYMNRMPNNLALDSVKNLMTCGVTQGFIQENYELFGHRDGRCTLCPGDMLYDDLQTWPHYSTRSIPVIC